MYNKPFIVHSDGTIFIFPKSTSLDEQQLEELESKLRQFTTSIDYREEVHIFQLDIYSIWSLLVMGDSMLQDFVNFLNSHSVNEFPDNLHNTIEDQKRNFKQVLIDKDLEYIIIRILRGDLKSLLKKTMKNEIKYDRKREAYIADKKHSAKITRVLLKDNVSIQLNNKIDDVESLPFKFKCTFSPRYYQSEALSLIKSKGQKNGVIYMPPGSGKSYIALKLIEYFQLPSLFLCNNCEEYWQDLIASNTIGLPQNTVSIYDTTNTTTPITICSYLHAIEALDTLNQVHWGIVFYDDAHRALADKSADTLYIKSKYKFALAATLARSDGKGRELYDIIGPRMYNIDWQELTLKRFCKQIEYTKVVSQKYNRIDLCKKIHSKYKDKNILITSYNLEEIRLISNILEAPLLSGEGNEDIKKRNEKNAIQDFTNGIIQTLCVTSILQRLQVTDIDVLIAITHQQGSMIEETFRIGRAASCSDQMNKPSKAKIFSIVVDDELKWFIKRLKPVSKYVPNPVIIDDTEVMDGDIKCNC